MVSKGLTSFFECLVGTLQVCMVSPQLIILLMNEFYEILNEYECKGIYVDELLPSFVNFNVYR